MTERNVKHSDETEQAKTARRRFPFGPLSGKGRRFLLALIEMEITIPEKNSSKRYIKG